MVISIELVQTAPFTELFSVGSLFRLTKRRYELTYVNQTDVVHGTQSGDELDVILLGAVLGQDAKVSFLAIQSLGALSQTTSETIVDESLLEDYLKARFKIEGFSFHGISAT